MAVERWSEWTASVRSIERLQPGPLGLSSRVRIRQPKLLPAVWTVTEFEEGRRFTWEARGLGFRTVAEHSISSTPQGTHAEFRIEFKGPLGGIAGRMSRALTERYMSWEAAGLKRQCEQPVPS